MVPAARRGPDDMVPAARKGPHVIVDSLDDVELDDESRHHLSRVRRLRAGDPLTVSDGRGRWADACWTGDALELSGPPVEVSRPSVVVAVAFSLVKGGRPELVVQKLTELGVDRIVPFVSERSVVRWDEVRGARHHARLHRVAREAAQQSKRIWLPEIEPVTSFSDLAGRPGSVAADLAGAPLLGVPELVLIGPEGGWSDSERSVRLPTVGLGDTVLRAETAALAVGTLLCALRGGRVAPVDTT